MSQIRSTMNQNHYFSSCRFIFVLTFLLLHTCSPWFCFLLSDTIQGCPGFLFALCLLRRCCTTDPHAAFCHSVSETLFGGIANIPHSFILRAGLNFCAVIFPWSFRLFAWSFNSSGARDRFVSKNLSGSISNSTSSTDYDLEFCCKLSNLTNLAVIIKD